MDLVEQSKTPILDLVTAYKDDRLSRVVPLNITVDWINKNRPLSQSSLKQFRKSPQHYIEYITQDKPEMKPAWVVGNLVDMMLLTPDGIDDKIALIPDLNLRTNVGKEAFQAFKESNEGKLLVKQEQLDTALECVKFVWKDEDAAYYLDKLRRTQIKLDWKHKETGLMNTGYLDGESDPEDHDYFILELKTAADASKDKFIRDAHNFEYHMQAGGYTLGMKKKFFRFPDFIHLVIETSYPFGVNVFRADDKYIEQAQNEYHNTLLAFKYCIDHNEFDKTYNFHRFNTRYNAMQLPGYFRPTFG